VCVACVKVRLKVDEKSANSFEAARLAGRKKLDGRATSTKTITSPSHTVFPSFLWDKNHHHHHLHSHYYHFSG